MFDEQNMGHASHLAAFISKQSVMLPHHFISPMCTCYHVLLWKSNLFSLYFLPFLPCVKYLVIQLVPLLTYFKLTTLGITVYSSQSGQFSGCAGRIVCLSSNGQHLCWHAPPFTGKMSVLLFFYLFLVIRPTAFSTSTSPNAWCSWEQRLYDH